MFSETSYEVILNNDKRTKGITMKKIRISKSYLLAGILLGLFTILKLCSIIVLCSLPNNNKALQHHIVEKEELPHDIKLKTLIKKIKKQTQKLID